MPYNDLPEHLAMRAPAYAPVEHRAQHKDASRDLQMDKVNLPKDKTSLFVPSSTPTSMPSLKPTWKPSVLPTASPTSKPSAEPSRRPTPVPTPTANNKKPDDPSPSPPSPPHVDAPTSEPTFQGRAIRVIAIPSYEITFDFATFLGNGGLSYEALRDFNEVTDDDLKQIIMPGSSLYKTVESFSFLTESENWGVEGINSRAGDSRDLKKNEHSSGIGDISLDSSVVAYNKTIHVHFNKTAVITTTAIADYTTDDTLNRNDEELRDALADALQSYFDRSSHRSMAARVKHASFQHLEGITFSKFLSQNTNAGSQYQDYINSQEISGSNSGNGNESSEDSNADLYLYGFMGAIVGLVICVALIMFKRRRNYSSSTKDMVDGDGDGDGDERMTKKQRMRIRTKWRNKRRNKARNSVTLNDDETIISGMTADTGKTGRTELILNHEQTGCAALACGTLTKNHDEDADADETVFERDRSGTTNMYNDGRCCTDVRTIDIDADGDQGTEAMTMYDSTVMTHRVRSDQNDDSNGLCCGGNLFSI